MHGIALKSDVFHFNVFVFFIEKCIVRLLECEMLQKEVLHSCNLELAKTRDSIAYLYISQGTNTRKLNCIV